MQPPLGALTCSLLNVLFAWSVGSDLVTALEPTFALRVDAIGTPVHGRFVSAYHIGPGDEIAVILAGEADTFCHFFLRGKNLAQLGGTPSEPYSATLVWAYGLSNVIQIAVGQSSATQWSLDKSNDVFLQHGMSSNFYACPNRKVAEFGPSEPLIGLGRAQEGCWNIRLAAVRNCSSSFSSLTSRSVSTTLYPNLLIPVDANQPDKTFGSVFSPAVNISSSLAIGFYPLSSGGRTCELHFLLPGTQANPGNGLSAYKLSGDALFHMQQTSGTLTDNTNWNNKPSTIGQPAPFHLTETSSILILTTSCGNGGALLTFEMSVTSGSCQWVETSASPAVGIVLVQY